MSSLRMQIHLSENITSMPAPITPQVKTVMDQIISCFENSTPVIQYDSVVNLDDGRGYTCGKAGFTTADGDALAVIDSYNQGPIMEAVHVLQTQQNPNNVHALDALGFSQLWKDACKDPAFIKAQDDVCDLEYFTPAYDLATQYKCDSNLGVLCFYDTAIENMGLTVPDSSIAGYNQKNAEWRARLRFNRIPC